jgi:hypothetical protein
MCHYVGEEPGLTAAGHGTAVVADTSSMAGTWPLFAASSPPR